MRIALLTCCWMILVGATSVAPAKTLYVNNQMGSDTASGLTAEPQIDNGPLKTIEAALILADKADRIVIANTGVPYHEAISLSKPNHSGYRNKPLVIEGNGAVLDGTVGHELGAWKHVQGNVFAMQPRRITYQQLFDGALPLQRVELLSTDELANLQPKTWGLLDGKIYFCTEEQKIPADYELRHAGLQTGITLYMVRHVRIENLVVQGFQQDGVNAHELVQDCELVDIDLRANGRAGLSVGGVSRVSVSQGNFYDNGRVQVRTEGLGELELAASEVDDSTAPAYRTKGRKLLVDGQPISAP
ncbi:right-handed parallel beta-helix repeat-containing protein [Aeoliella mucimassa]|uniref:Right handed beta helix domain-containing protein n=1 Tax=Aeoliella mucimassa TaxID=2527972 RepID=A0A518AJH7_9BACT|nr:right-handed parallel beta-helix repeat-containing protein [Aeoliella mucimassa]QDU54888.1 hypothetical protein Pan181_10720 [Aeoliella mucimassa]